MGLGRALGPAPYRTYAVPGGGEPPGRTDDFTGDTRKRYDDTAPHHLPPSAFHRLTADEVG